MSAAWGVQQPPAHQAAARVPRCHRCGARTAATAGEAAQPARPARQQPRKGGVSAPATPGEKPKAAQSGRRPAVNARAIAVQQLLRVEDGGAYTSLLKRGGTNDSDARLVTRLVTGTTVWRLNLDAVIAGLDPALPKLDDTVRNVLRVALFELLHSGTAPHAAVDAAVTATKALGKASAAGLVNALLRKALRQREAGTLQVPIAQPSDGAPQLSVAYSMPEWLVSRWLHAFGRDGTEQLLIASNRDTPAYGVRACGDTSSDVHSLVEVLTAMGVAATLSTLLPKHFARVDGTLAPLMPHLRSGSYAVQDEAAGLVVMLLAHDLVAGRQTRVADVCAAPGGKALFSAALGAHVTAIEVNPGRARLLREAAEAQGVAGRVDVHVADARSWAAEHVDSHQAFHIVLVDAPCTGTGVMAKRADMRWRRTAEDIAAAAGLQLELLTASSVLVAPGGCLVYSTCSLEAEENQEVVTAFLATPQGAAFRLQPAGATRLRRALAGPEEADHTLKPTAPVAAKSYGCMGGVSSVYRDPTAQLGGSRPTDKGSSSVSPLPLVNGGVSSAQ